MYAKQKFYFLLCWREIKLTRVKLYGTYMCHIKIEYECSSKFLLKVNIRYIKTIWNLDTLKLKYSLLATKRDSTLVGIVLLRNKYYFAVQILKK